MKMTATRPVTKTTKKKIDRSSTVFYCVMVALPLLQFLIFYVVVNFNSILMAFQEYNTLTFSTTLSLSNFEGWFTKQTLPILGVCLKNSMIYFGVTLLAIPISLCISYYIYKKFHLSQFFKVISFIPSIICISALAIMYKTFVNYGMSSIFTTAPISLEYSEARQPMLIVFYLLVNFSGNLLIYINAMSQASPSVIEAAKIDGASEFRIFIHVIIPQIWGPIVSLLIIFMAGIVTNQAFLFTFFGINAPAELQTLGYFIFRNIQEGATPNVEASYYQTSALGIMLTLVLAPITILVRNLMLKFGPRED